MDKMQMLFSKNPCSTMSKKQKNDKTLDKCFNAYYYKHIVNYYKN